MKEYVNRAEETKSEILQTLSKRKKLTHSVESYEISNNNNNLQFYLKTYENWFFMLQQYESSWCTLQRDVKASTKVENICRLKKNIY